MIPLSEDVPERAIWTERLAALQRMRDNQIAAIARTYGVPAEVAANLLEAGRAAGDRA